MNSDRFSTVIQPNIGLMIGPAVNMKGRPWGKAAVSLGLAALLSACAHSPSRELVADYGAANETPARFGICASYGCRDMIITGLSGAEWAAVTAAFGAPADPAEEREAIRRAIGEIERLVGPKTGTAFDAPGARIVNFDRRGQMDCIDEAFNTTTYLRFLERDGLLRHHHVDLPIRRGSFIDRWPHNTAIIIESASGAAYAVDSWFHGNGVPPEIVAAEVWLKGWSPDTALTLDQWRTQTETVQTAAE